MLFTPRILYPSLSLAVLFACASEPPQPPSWIEKRPAAFENERWVVAVGQGTSLLAAEEAARSDVAAQTKGETQDTVIAETWRNPQSGRSWAMAVFDRVPVRQALQSERGKIAKEIIAKVSVADGAPSEQALRELVGAMTLTSEREVLDERIANLGGVVPSDPVVPQRPEIGKRLSDVKRLLPIEIASYEMHPKTGETGDPLDEIRRLLTQKVIELGFAVADAQPSWGDDSTWLVVTSKLALDRLHLRERDTLVAVHWDHALEIKNLAENGQVVALLTQQGRATHLNEREARRQARADAMEFAQRALDEWLSTQIGEAAP